MKQKWPPDKMKNKVMLTLAEIPSTGFIVERLESKFLYFLNQDIFTWSLLDIVKLLNILLPTTAGAVLSRHHSYLPD